jgi:hypothetical protein
MPGRLGGPHYDHVPHPAVIHSARSADTPRPVGSGHEFRGCELIRVLLDETTVSRTRIAVSPLNELVAGLYLLVRRPGEVPWPYADWTARARAILAGVPETAPLAVYADIHGPAHARPTPDFFTPVPPSPRPTLADELASCGAPPRALIREQLAKHYPEGLPSYLVPYRDDPGRALSGLSDALTAFWEPAIAPRWPAMRTVLDEEVLVRSRTLAADGPGPLLAGLNGKLRWDPPVLSLLGKTVESAISAVDRRLLLVPLLFARNTLMVSTDHPEIVTVSYQARGAAVLAEWPGARVLPTVPAREPTQNDHRRVRRLDRSPGL